MNGVKHLHTNIRETGIDNISSFFMNHQNSLIKHKLAIQSKNKNNP